MNVALNGYKLFLMVVRKQTNVAPPYALIKSGERKILTSLLLQQSDELEHFLNSISVPNNLLSTMVSNKVLCSCGCGQNVNPSTDRRHREAAAVPHLKVDHPKRKTYSAKKRPRDEQDDQGSHKKQRSAQSESHNPNPSLGIAPQDPLAIEDVEPTGMEILDGESFELSYIKAID